MSYQKIIAAMLARSLSGPLAMDAVAIGDLQDFVEVPKDSKNGDFAFPCFRLAKWFRKKPNLIAEQLLPHLKKALVQQAEIASVTALGPYLNFCLDRGFMAAELIPAILDGTYLAPRPSQGQKVMIEYSQPNTHKAFHVGHTRNVALGDALVRLFEWNGFEVVAANYIGDEGTHIAKCLWYYRNHFQGRTPDNNLGEFLGDLYTRATLMLDFGRLTRCPLPGVTTARVTAIQSFQDHKQLKVVQVLIGGSEVQVICGGSDYQVGDVVAYAAVGARILGRRIGVFEKAGVSSRGMICSEKELGLSEDHQRIYTFPGDTETGVDVAEYFRIEGALDPAVPVLEEMERRTSGVAETLRQLEAKDPEIDALWQATRRWSLDEFDRIYRWLNARFDHFFFESEVGETGKNIVLELYNQGVLVKSEGAIGADLETYNLPFLLLLKSDGSGLYATKDIALAREKFENFHVDRSIYVVDASQSLHFQQVFKALEIMGYERAKHCFHLAYGLVVLPEGKMSSRSGNIILLSELREKLDQKIKHEFLDKYRDQWPETEIDEASRRISIATIKYGMVNQDNLKNIVFDLDEWTARTGNTGPYLLYAYARTRSILREADHWNAALADWSLLDHETEAATLSLLSKFVEVAQRACDDYRPQTLCIYLYQLAKDFSRMYDHCPVLKAESEALKTTRLLLVDGVGRVLKQGLALLGIPTLERM